MSYGVNEEIFEKKVVDIFRSMKYNVIDGEMDEAWQGMSSPVNEKVLTESLPHLSSNKHGQTEEAFRLAVDKVMKLSDESLRQGASCVEKNKLFTEWMRSGVSGKYENGEKYWVHLLDYYHPEKNVFHCVRQWTYEEHSKRRPDVVVFLNGLPVAVIELKSPTSKDYDTKNACNQIAGTYMEELPTLFAYNCICAVSDGNKSLAGTITSDHEHFSVWKETGSGENSESEDDTGTETFFRGIFEPKRLVEIIRNFIFYKESGSKPQKVLARYYQYECAKKALEATEKSSKFGVIGVVCPRGNYTDSMVSYVRSVKQSEKLKDATIIVATDDECRNSLYRRFHECPALPKCVYQVKYLDKFNKFFDGSSQGTNREKPIIITPLSVLEKIKELNPLKGRDDIIVIADKLSPKRKFFGGLSLEQHLLEYLPKASYIGFTETPIETGDENGISWPSIPGIDQAVKATEDVFKSKRDGLIGTVYVAHGSGTLTSMLFYVRQLKQSWRFKEAAIVVVADDEERRNYLYDQFKKCEYFQGNITWRKKRDSLRAALEKKTGKTSNIIFTTLDTLMKRDSQLKLTNRDDVIIIVDDLYRKKRIWKHHSLKQVLRDNMPKASYIGFTGVPLEENSETFGPLIYCYSMEQSIEDGSTCDFSYESRAREFEPDSDTLEKVDKEVRELKSNKKFNPSIIQEALESCAQIEFILGSDVMVNYAVSDLIAHYETHSKYDLSCKAIVVAQSRPIAMKLYNKIIEIRPEWKDGKIKTLMPKVSTDDEDVKKLACRDDELNERLEEFKDNTSELKIAIVADVLLSRFDVSSLAVLYIYKKMPAHELIEAVSRVNRICPGKLRGQVVDYIGSLQELNRYYMRQENKKGDISAFYKHLNECKEIFSDFDYSQYLKSFVPDEDKYHIAEEAVKYIRRIWRKPLCADFYRSSKLMIDAYTGEWLNEGYKEYKFFKTVHDLLVNKPVGGIKSHLGRLMAQCVKSVSSGNDALADLPMINFSFIERTFMDRAGENMEKPNQINGDVRQSNPIHEEEAHQEYSEMGVHPKRSASLFSFLIDLIAGLFRKKAPEDLLEAEERAVLAYPKFSDIFSAFADKTNANVRENEKAFMELVKLKEQAEKEQLDV